MPGNAYCPVRPVRRLSEAVHATDAAATPPRTTSIPQDRAGPTGERHATTVSLSLDMKAAGRQIRTAGGCGIVMLSLRDDDASRAEAWAAGAAAVSGLVLLGDLLPAGAFIMLSAISLAACPARTAPRPTHRPASSAQ